MSSHWNVDWYIQVEHFVNVGKTLEENQGIQLYNLGNPVAQASLEELAGWRVTIVPPVDDGEGPRLALSEVLFGAVRPYARRG